MHLEDSSNVFNFRFRTTFADGILFQGKIRKEGNEKKRNHSQSKKYPQKLSPTF